MATDQEMQRGLEFNRNQAAKYQAIADKGGNEHWTKAAAQAQADSFQAYADRIADRIEERTF
jgi:hypothetical protein